MLVLSGHLRDHDPYADPPSGDTLPGYQRSTTHMIRDASHMCKWKGSFPQRFAGAHSVSTHLMVLSEK